MMAGTSTARASAETPTIQCRAVRDRPKIRVAWDAGFIAATMPRRASEGVAAATSFSESARTFSALARILAAPALAMVAPTLAST